MSSKPPISEEDLKKALVEMAAALAQFHAEYAVIGGMARGYRSQPRFTKDLDILVAIPQLVLPGLLHELQRRGFVFDLPTVLREWTQEHMTVVSFRGLRIDWLKPVLPAYLHILDRATEEAWFGQPIRVASAEGLILLKLLAFRTQDLVDIENLVATHPGSLDLEWIKEPRETVMRPPSGAVTCYAATPQSVAAFSEGRASFFRCEEPPRTRWRLWQPTIDKLDNGLTEADC